MLQPAGPAATATDDIDSDGDDRIKLDDVAEMIGQDKSSAGNQMLEGALSGMSQRWRNWIIRGIFTWVMIGGFTLIVVYGGPLGLMVITLFVQVI